MNELISIIIPCYNAEKTIKNTLNSILEQSYKNLEVIIVNDGSSDHTLDIANFYSFMDDRVKVVTQSNKGVAAARNNGLSMARGEYINFIDADDNYTNPNALSEMLEKIHQFDADMCVCNFVHPCFSQHLSEGLYDLTNQHDFFTYYQDFFASSMPWNKLAKRKCYTEPFIYGMKLGEDEIFNLENLHNLKKVYVLDKVYYNYYCTPYIPNDNASAITGAMRDSNNRDSVWHTFMKSQHLREDIVNKYFSNYKENMQYIRSFDFLFWVFFLMANNRVPEELLIDTYKGIFSDDLMKKTLEAKAKRGYVFKNITDKEIEKFCSVSYKAFRDIKLHNKALSLYKVLLGIFAEFMINDFDKPVEDDILYSVAQNLKANSTPEAIYTNLLLKGFKESERYYQVKMLEDLDDLDYKMWFNNGILSKVK